MNALEAIRPLPAELHTHGYALTQVERGKCWAIYAQRRGSVLVAYEAIRVRTRVARQIAGKWVGPQEIYPSDSRWGTDAWTFSLFGGKVSANEALAQARDKIAAIRRELSDPPESNAAPVAENDTGRARNKRGVGSEIGEGVPGVNAFVDPHASLPREARI